MTTPLFANGLRAKEIVARVPEDTGFIGVSCMFSNEWIYHKRVINALAERFPGVPIAVGGEHGTAASEYVLKSCPAVTACVRGEGEETLLDLLDALNTGRPLSEVNGIAHRADDGAPVRTAKRNRMRELDTLPWPDWDDIPLRNYLDRGIGHGINRGRNMPMLASRGCPYECAFCSNPQMWGRLWNIRSPRNVADELKARIAEYNIDSFSFYDLTFVIRKKWTMEFTKILQEEGIKLEWHMPSGTRSEALDAEVMRELSKTGLTYVTYAPESGSKRTLERIKKKVDLDNMLKSIRACVKEGVFCKANMVYGFPGDTWGDIMLSYAFVVRLAWAGMHDVAAHPFVPYPGSQFTEELRQSRGFPEDGEPYDLFLANNCNNKYSNIQSWNETISGKALQYICFSSMLLFYACQYVFRPWRFFSLTYRIARSNPLTLPERVIFNLFNRFKRLGSSKASEIDAPAESQNAGT